MKLLPVAGLLSILVLGAHAVCKHPSSLTDAEQAVLDKHNKLRRLHKDTDDLCYGETGSDISFYAQHWAEEMAANKQTSGWNTVQAVTITIPVTRTVRTWRTPEHPEVLPPKT